jgi:hypothetical protein
VNKEKHIIISYRVKQKSGFVIQVSQKKVKTPIRQIQNANTIPLLFVNAIIETATATVTAIAIATATATATAIATATCHRIFKI